MKSNEKKMIVVLLIILAVVIGLKINQNKKNSENKNGNRNETVQTSQKKEEYVEVLDDGTKLNTSKALAKERKVDGFSFTNIALANMNGTTMLIADVKNTKSTATELTPVLVEIVDKKGNVLTSLQGLISPMEAGATTQLNIGVTADYTANAYDFKIEILK